MQKQLSTLGLLLSTLALALSLAACLPDRTEPLPGLKAAIRVSDISALTAAMEVASRQPSTTIKFAVDIASPDTLYLRGRGTTLDLNGHAFTYTGHFNGSNGGGCGIYVMPVVSEAMPMT